MNRKVALVAVAFAALVLGALVYLTLNLGGVRVEVCKEYGGRTACRIASGGTQAEATRTASDNACALISSGVTDSVACQQSAPISVKVLTSK